MPRGFRRHGAATVLLAAALLSLPSCGGVSTSTNVEKRNLRTVELVPEAKARSVRPLLGGRYDAARGILALSAVREFSGELHQYESYDEATVKVKSKDPNPVGFLLGGPAAALAIVLSPFDEKLRKTTTEALAGAELGRKENVVARTSGEGRPLGRDGSSRAPWADARVAVLVEDAPSVEVVADADGNLAVNLYELVDRPALLLDRESLHVRARVMLDGRPTETSIHLPAAETAALRRLTAAHAAERGRGAARTSDFPAAARHFRLGAELGDADAQMLLAGLYRDGQGMPQNHAEAERWLRRAALQGQPEAQLVLAESLMRETRGPRDVAQAYVWASLAAARLRDGLHRRAVTRRDDIARRLDPAELGRAQSQAAAFTPVAELREAGSGGAATAEAIAEPLPPLDPSRLVGKRKSDAIALIIGVEEYQRLPAAQFAARDARVFRDFAVNGLGIAPERVKLLVGADARLLDIQKALDTWLTPEIKDGATDVYVFFSGHGLASENGRNLYLFPYDGDRALLEKSAIDRAATIDSILKAGAKSLTLFLDTCYSGGTRGNDTLIADIRPVIIRARDGEVPSPAAVLAASRNDQWSSSFAAARHGLFSYYLMRGLMGEADADSDHRITLGELHSYAERQVRREASRKGSDQNPVLVGGGDKVLVAW
ncbi:caspase family protein [Paramagnetospirillum marisnigri]|nr:caspase family protein [Paramagnetospirillum marisnigri]